MFVRLSDWQFLELCKIAVLSTCVLYCFYLSTIQSPMSAFSFFPALFSSSCVTKFPISGRQLFAVALCECLCLSGRVSAFCSTKFLLTLGSHYLNYILSTLILYSTALCIFHLRPSILPPISVPWLLGNLLCVCRSRKDGDRTAQLFLKLFAKLVFGLKSCDFSRDLLGAGGNPLVCVCPKQSVP